MEPILIIAAIIALLAVLIVVKSVALVPQAEAAVVERLGRYTKTVSGQLLFLMPFVDRIRAKVDLRERVVSFPPQPVITEDNLTVNIDTVVYFQVTDPRSAVYEINNYIVGVEQLTTTTLRNVVGGMTLEETLTSRERINSQLRGVLDEATSRWGLRVARVELKSIFPPPSIQESMEKQMKADREKRATILAAEGHRESAIKSAEGDKQSQILAAEGAKQAAILAAEGDRQSRILRAQGDRAAKYLMAQGEAKSIEKTFAAIRASKPTPELLAYEYIRQIPKMAEGEASKVWVVPTDFGSALQGFAKSFGQQTGDGSFTYTMPDYGEAPEVHDEDVADWFDLARDPAVAKAVAEAEAVARQSVDHELPGRSSSGSGSGSSASSVPPAAPEPAEPAGDPRAITSGDGGQTQSFPVVPPQQAGGSQQTQGVQLPKAPGQE
ncbi:SPFH domain-containing protein [Yimella sp. cx-51]|uniref:SPFH domain-containing protein n=1 Tax=Yimella sp. cx-51 TaxID=2770551 RepID=UPI00165D3895|nr:SPFH domain-containing protein [Yimella sp. cx-51]MBC9956037.1 SPFH/Band 7/PHB domain protein [Yimella sp. cx-51]QTH37427.1 SPFH/Band 7/PHB domain protein [Yimella sp. cx-51]